MSSIPDEIRLLLAVSLNAWLLWAADRFVRRRGSTGSGRLADALLFYLLAQYIVVGTAGLLGVLSPWVVVIGGMGAAGLLSWMGRQPDTDRQLGKPNSLEKWAPVAAIGFIVGLLAALIYAQRYLPVMSEDALIYHMPAAAQWLREGRITLLPTWFFNPANTWSPLAGSIFAAWWLAPLGNDVLARFAQIPGALLICAAIFSLARSLRASPLSSAILAAATILCAPLIGQAVFPNDDLYATAFFLAAVAALAPRTLQDSLGPWRFGAALGLMLATKYTALMALPLLALGADAPFKAGWRLRHFAITTLLLLLLAAPWYVRNILTEGNPLYPVDVTLFGHTLLHGLFPVGRSLELSTFTGAWHAITNPARRFSIPIPVIIALITGWIAVPLLYAFQKMRGAGPLVSLSDPLARLCFLGPPLALAIFFLFSPYSETRFLFPPIVLLFACWAILVTAKSPAAARYTVFSAIPVAILLLLCLATSFNQWGTVAFLAASGAIGSIILCVGSRWRFWWSNQKRDARMLILTAAILIASSLLYVQWTPYINQYRQLSADAWAFQYGPIAEGWRFVRQKTPRDASIAYSGSPLIYPLQGFELDRRVVYVPTRRSLQHLDQLPHFHEPLSGEMMETAIDAALTSQPDADQWIQSLKASGATWLLVARQAMPPPPPEIELALRHPSLFRVAFENPSVIVYQLNLQ